MREKIPAPNRTPNLGELKGPIYNFVTAKPNILALIVSAFSFSLSFLSILPQTYYIETVIIVLALYSISWNIWFWYYFKHIGEEVLQIPLENLDDIIKPRFLVYFFKDEIDNETIDVEKSKMLFDISGSDAKMAWQITGKTDITDGQNLNNQEEKVNNLKIKIADDRPIDQDDINLSSYKVSEKYDIEDYCNTSDKVESELDLHNKLDSDRSSTHYKIFEIYFKNPLKDNKKFNIVVTCEFDSFNRKEDHVVFPLTILGEEVDEFEGRVILDEVPTYKEAERIFETDSGFINIEQIDFDDDDEGIITISDTNTSGLYRAEFIRNKPSKP